MRKIIILSAVAAVALATPALAADKKVKAVAPPVAPYNPWDVAFGAGLTSDYIFRGITQSNHKPSVAAYFEPRYNVTKDLQYYVGIAGESISFPNRAAAEIDLYAGDGARALLGGAGLTLWLTGLAVFALAFFAHPGFIAHARLVAHSGFERHKAVRSSLVADIPRRWNPDPHARAGSTRQIQNGPVHRKTSATCRFRNGPSRIRNRPWNPYSAGSTR